MDWSGTLWSAAPHEFYLYNHQGEIAVRYGGDAVHFDPGSSGVNILDPRYLEHRPSVTADLVQMIQVTEMLPEYAAQSTAVVCNDVPKEIGDLYRLYLVLLYASKPVITGAFSPQYPGDDRHAGAVCRRAEMPCANAPGGLRCLPFPAVDLERVRRRQPDRPGAGRRAGGDGLHAAGRGRLARSPSWARSSSTPPNA